MPNAFHVDEYAMTVPQIAQHLNMTEKEVKATLERARYKLRIALQKRGLCDRRGNFRDE